MKTKRNVIIAAVITALLVIGTVILLNIDTDKKDETLPEGNAVNKVYSEDASNLKEVKVTTADGEIRAVNTGKSDWTINDLPKGEVDPNKAYSLAGTVSTIISKNVYENNGDLAQYGLDNPSVTVTITKKNGDADTLYVGDFSPVLDEYFIQLEGDSNVYTLYSYKVEMLMKPLEYYKEFNRFSVNIDDITGIRIERADGETMQLKIMDKDKQNMANVWEMTEPYESPANDDYIDNKILARIENIALTEPVDAPFTGKPAKLTLTVKPYDNATGKYGEEYTEAMEIGGAEGDITYVRYGDNIYTTPSESVAFVNDSPFNVVSKLHALVDISLVKNVELEYGGEKHIIDVKRENGNNYSFKLDGKETDTKVSQEIYRNIIGLAVDSVYDGAEAGETLLKIRYNTAKNDDNTEIIIKQLDDLNCVMERNGEALFTIKKSKIDEFITLFDTYVKAHE